MPKNINIFILLSAYQREKHSITTITVDIFSIFFEKLLFLSAIYPKNGQINAITIPETAIAQPHNDIPEILSSAILLVK